MELVALGFGKVFSFFFERRGEYWRDGPNRLLCISTLYKRRRRGGKTFILAVFLGKTQ